MPGDHVLDRCRPATGTCEALQGKSLVSYTVPDKAAHITPNKPTTTTTTAITTFAYT